VAVPEVVELLVERLVEDVLGDPPRGENRAAEEEHPAEVELRGRRDVGPEALAGHHRDEVDMAEPARSEVWQQLLEQRDPPRDLRPLVLGGRDGQRLIALLEQMPQAASEHVARVLVAPQPEMVGGRAEAGQRPVAERRVAPPLAHVAGRRREHELAVLDGQRVARAVGRLERDVGVQHRAPDHGRSTLVSPELAGLSVK
jgi:hypothetical protein